MKKTLLFFLIFHQFVQVAQVDRSDELVTNLLIFNDGCDLYYPDFADWVQQDPGSGAIIMEMAIGLLENQLVLCTKSLWVSMQNIVQIWNDFVNKSEQELIDDFENTMKEYEKTNIEKLKFMFEKYAYRKEIKSQKSLILQLNGMYEKLIQETKDVDNLKNKYAIAQSLIKQFKEGLYPISMNKFSYDSVCSLFRGYLVYQIILNQNYICKKIQIKRRFDVRNEEYLLFIPKDMNNNFDWNLLIDYKYNKFIDCYALFDRMESYNDQNSLGAELLKTLKILISLKKDKNIDSFFNVFISGHGDKNMIAEISIESQESEIENKKSDFLKLLDFFQYDMQVQSLGISACYPGGQKIHKTFDVSNQFNNFKLEHVSYPVIFVGSFFAVTYVLADVHQPFIEDRPQFYTNKFLYGPSDDVNRHMYQQYFQYLNQQPANYEGAARVISNVFNFKNNTIKFEKISNFVSIKYPNISWFVPVELKTDEEFQKIQTLGSKKIEDIQKKQIKKNELLKDLISSDDDSSVSSDDDSSVRENITAEVQNIQKYSKYAQTISQIEASAQSTINIDENKKIILLQANVIKTIHVNSIGELPIFLPVNHYNQCYVIDTLDASGIELQNINEALVQSMLPISKIEEPVHIVIKELKTKTQILKNVYAF
ncbi:hypothetical protein KBB68_03905, partial [Candidatus Babeliales bacterium]|nr:hypothetical protein [Candidatus Babeliales bacterium]